MCRRVVSELSVFLPISISFKNSILQSLQIYNLVGFFLSYGGGGNIVGAPPVPLPFLSFLIFPPRTLIKGK